MEDERLFPPGQLDVNGQQLDLRDYNSWILRLEELSPYEVVEVFAINAIVPFLMNGRLKKKMMESPHVRNNLVVLINYSLFRTDIG